MAGAGGRQQAVWLAGEGGEGRGVRRSRPAAAGSRRVITQQLPGRQQGISRQQQGGRCRSGSQQASQPLSRARSAGCSPCFPCSPPSSARPALPTGAEDESRWFFQQLAVGLAYFHSIGQDNRELNLNNKLLTGDATRPLLKINDFTYRWEGR